MPITPQTALVRVSIDVHIVKCNGKLSVFIEDNAVFNTVDCFLFPKTIFLGGFLTQHSPDSYFS